MSQSRHGQEPVGSASRDALTGVNNMIQQLEKCLTELPLDGKYMHHLGYLVSMYHDGKQVPMQMNRSLAQAEFLASCIEETCVEFWYSYAAAVDKVDQSTSCNALLMPEADEGDSTVSTMSAFFTLQGSADEYGDFRLGTTVLALGDDGLLYIFSEIVACDAICTQWKAEVRGGLPAKVGPSGVPIFVQRTVSLSFVLDMHETLHLLHDLKSVARSRSLASILGGKRTVDVPLPAGADLQGLLAGLNPHQTGFVSAALRSSHFNIVCNGVPGSGKSVTLNKFRRMLPMSVKCLMCAQANSMVRRVFDIVIPSHAEFPVVFVGSKFAEPECLFYTAENQAQRASSVVLLSAFLAMLQEHKSPVHVLHCLQDAIQMHLNPQAPPAHLRATAGPEDLKVTDAACVSVAELILARRGNALTPLKNFVRSLRRKEVARVVDRIWADASVVLCTTSCISRVADALPENTQVCAFLDEAAAAQDSQVARFGIIEHLLALFWQGDRYQCKPFTQRPPPNKPSLFEVVFAQRHILGIQYRCDPMICRAWKSFYPDSGALIRTAHGVHMDAGERKFPPLVFLDTHNRLAGKTRVPGEGKHSNVAVARLAMEVLLELSALHPDWTVAVCCFYNDQVQNLLRTIAPERVQCRVTVDTVDGFQGKEYDAIVMACGVWQQGGATSQANWEDFRRINVFLSRARMQVVLVASSSILSSLYWRRERGCAPKSAPALLGLLISNHR